MRLLIVVAGIVVYLNSFQGVFLFDDEDAITKNPYIRGLWPPATALTAPPQSPAAGRPLVSLSLAINYACGGLNPWGYHAFNLAVHILSALFLFGVIRRTLSLPRIGLGSEVLGRRLAGVITLIWVVHPLLTESVTYVIQRTESMAGLFYLLTLYCFIRGANGRTSRAWYAAAIAACALGMTTKETMVTAPLLVLIYDRVFVARSWAEITALRRSLYFGLAATWLILVLLVAAGPRSQTVGFALGLGPVEYAMNQCPAIVNYLRLAFWPHPLILDYGEPKILPLGSVLPQAAILAVLLILTAVALFRRPHLGFPGVWFFVILAPTSSFVPITSEVAAERRMYLPLAAVITLAVMLVWWGGSAIGKRIGLRPRARNGLFAALVIAVVLPLSYATVRRNRTYHDAETMWRDVLAGRPDNPRAHCGLAFTLAARGLLDPAIRHYETALAIQPDNAVTQANLAGVLARAGRLDEAVERYSAAIRLDPNFAVAQVSLGNALRLKGDLEGAAAAHRRAIEIDPALGDAFYNLGLDLDAIGRHDLAIDAYVKALQLHPSHPGAKAALAAAASRPAGK